MSDAIFDNLVNIRTFYHVRCYLAKQTQDFTVLACERIVCDGSFWKACPRQSISISLNYTTIPTLSENQNKEEILKDIITIGEKITKVRRKIKLCDNIEKQSLEKLEQIKVFEERQKQEKEQKKNKKKDKKYER